MNVTTMKEDADRLVRMLDEKTAEALRAEALKRGVPLVVVVREALASVAARITGATGSPAPKAA